MFFYKPTQILMKITQFWISFVWKLWNIIQVIFLPCSCSKQLLWRCTMDGNSL